MLASEIVEIIIDNPGISRGEIISELRSLYDVNRVNNGISILLEEEIINQTEFSYYVN